MADPVKPLLSGSIFLRTLAIVTATALLGAFASYRFTRAGAWLPSIPDEIAYPREDDPNKIEFWSGIDAPIDARTLQTLGNPPPRAVGRQYVNPFSEVVFASFVTAGDFDNYHDPTVCVPSNGFNLSGKKTFSMEGPGKANVRAMVFKRLDPKYGEVRILMYYWQQNRRGGTATEARMGNYRDLSARINTGFGTVVLGNQNVLVRVYTFIASDDPKGVQAQRNVEHVSRALYRHLLKEGSEGSD
jgi:hypothetical protein